MEAELKVRFFAAAAAACGVEEQRVGLDAAGSESPLTLDGLATLLAESFPTSASVGAPPLPELLGRCSFLVNEVAQRDPGFVLQPGDVVDVLPPFAGG